VAGIGCEPASAASVAGVRSARRAGLIGAEERVVAVLTGHLLKQPESVRRPDGNGGNVPVEIEPSLDAIERAMR
jgi:threonine synthase